MKHSYFSRWGFYVGPDIYVKNEANEFFPVSRWKKVGWLRQSDFKIGNDYYIRSNEDSVNDPPGLKLTFTGENLVNLELSTYETLFDDHGASEVGCLKLINKLSLRTRMLIHDPRGRSALWFLLGASAVLGIRMCADVVDGIAYLSVGHNAQGDRFEDNAFADLFFLLGLDDWQIATHIAMSYVVQPVIGGSLFSIMGTGIDAIQYGVRAFIGQESAMQPRDRRLR